MATRGLYKRGTVWWIRYVGIDGRSIFESSRSQQFRVAEALLIKRKQSIKEGKLPEVVKIKNHTFNELAQEYEKWAARQRSFHTKQGFINALKKRFGHYPLRRFNSMMLEQYQTEKMQRNRPATVNRHLATIKHMFTKAVEWNMVEEDVLKRIRKVKLLQENNRRLRYLTQEECQALINGCDAHARPIVIMALNTGMRKGEILNLKWENIDLKNGFILLNQEQTKNGERKEIPINSTLREALLKITRRLDIPYVFFNPKTDKPYDNIVKSFYTAMKRAGIRDFRVHDLRHTFASHLVMAGVDLTTVRELLGHKTLTMTLRYSHLAPSHKVRAVDILDSKLNEGEGYSQKLQSV
jgi:integrase